MLNGYDIDFQLVQCNMILVPFFLLPIYILIMSCYLGKKHNQMLKHQRTKPEWKRVEILIFYELALRRKTRNRCLHAKNFHGNIFSLPHRSCFSNWKKIISLFFWSDLLSNIAEIMWKKAAIEGAIEVNSLFPNITWFYWHSKDKIQKDI